MPWPDSTRDAILSVETQEPTAFGTGFLSGVLSALLGIGGLGAVLCLHFPDLLTKPELRALYSLPYLRPLIHLTLVASFVFGSVSAVLRRNKALAVAGIGTTLVAALLGGSQVALREGQGSGTPLLGVDFFVLNLLLYSAVFIPLERRFALRREQPVFRREWPVDLTYFFINSLLIEVLTFVTLRPTAALFAPVQSATVTAFVSSLPLIVQVAVLILLADFCQYWIHRTFHTVPVLWRFHAIHHSVEEMDWLAGSRLHLVDVIATRALVYVPIFVLGFSQAALMIYVFIVAAQATFIHANVRWEFRGLRRLVATPAFHHWHHSSEREAIDRNFSVHVTLWDLLFGTFHLPERWPEKYGLHGGRDVPARWVTQLLYPFRK